MREGEGHRGRGRGKEGRREGGKGGRGILGNVHVQCRMEGRRE